MRKKPLIAECAFGWGQKFRLYTDYLDVSGTYYALDDLTHVRPIYQRFMGIPSLRLELCFGKKKVVLRGIAAIKDARRVIEYLTSHYLDSPVPETGRHKVWSRTRNFEDESQMVPTAELALPEYTSLSRQELYLKERAQAPTDKVETPRSRRHRLDERERKERPLYVERSLRERSNDVEKLVRHLKEESLPEIQVALRLLPGECAHYSTDATLCGEPIGGAMRYTYPPKDQGTLILTNKRLIYMGRTGQIVLDYARLLHVSRLRGAIAFQAEHWYRREIFEVPRSLECTMYLECILEERRGPVYHTRPHVSTSRYLDYHRRTEEASQSLIIDTMPLSMHSWELAEMLDTMNGLIDR